RHEISQPTRGDLPAHIQQGLSMTDLHTVTAELAQAQADLALLQRLTTAAERVERLTADHAKAQAAHDKAAEDAAAAAREARFNGLSNFRVSDITPADARDSGLTH